MDDSNITVLCEDLMVMQDDEQEKLAQQTVSLEEAAIALADATVEVVKENPVFEAIFGQVYFDYLNAVAQVEIEGSIDIEDADPISCSSSEAKATEASAALAEEEPVAADTTCELVDSEVAFCAAETEFASDMSLFGFGEESSFEVADAKDGELEEEEPPVATEKIRLCSNCGASMSEDYNFCEVCGTPVEKQAGLTCPDCGKPAKPDNRFCMYCGHRFA